MDTNRLHLWQNGAGAVLSGLAFACATIVSVTGNDPLGVPHAFLIVYTALAGSWFTCGLARAAQTRLRKRGLV